MYRYVNAVGWIETVRSNMEHLSDLGKTVEINGRVLKLYSDPDGYVWAV
jgi:hypothetical protein